MLDQAKERFDRVIAAVADDMSTIKVGIAKPAMVEHVEVEAYGPGQRMKLVELASISAPDPTQILISPWDRSVVRAIEKGILEANLGFMPNVNGDVIRIIVPPLTEERRNDYVKLLHQKLESGRVMLRNARQEIKDGIEGQKGEAGISEDDIKSQLEKLQKLVDEYMAKLEAMAQAKEAEIMKL